MKKIIQSIILVFALLITLISCRETKSAGEKMEDGIEQVGEGIEESAEELEEEFEKGAEEIEEEVKDVTDDN